MLWPSSLVWIRMQTTHTVQVVPFKTQPNNNHVTQNKNEIRWGSTTVYSLPASSVTLESTSHWLPGRCSHQLRKSCAGASMVCSRAERVFVLEHNFASKSFAAVCETFSNAYPDKEVPNKTTIHRLVKKFRDTGSVCVSSRGGGHLL
jgi:hypothetical protein